MQKKNKNFKLCSRFKALRESKSSIERDYTQDMLAKALKISKTQISNLEIYDGEILSPNPIRNFERSKLNYERKNNQKTILDKPRRR